MLSEQRLCNARATVTRTVVSALIAIPLFGMESMRLKRLSTFGRGVSQQLLWCITIGNIGQMCCFCRKIIEPVQKVTRRNRNFRTDTATRTHRPEEGSSPPERAGFPSQGREVPRQNVSVPSDAKTASRSAARTRREAPPRRTARAKRPHADRWSSDAEFSRYRREWLLRPEAPWLR